MPLDKVEEYIEKNRDEYLEQLFMLLRQPSISTEDEGIRDCVELLKGMMIDIGIDTQVMETNGHPVLYGEMMNADNDFTLLIYGHYDVQPPEPLEEWTSEPFEPEVREGRIYARGAGDNKGQLMAQLLGIRTYKALYDDLPINIKFVFEGEEEEGSKHLPDFVNEHQELLKSDLVYTADGSSHNSGAPLILLGVRGVLALEFTASGADRDNHSGNTGNIVPNPSWKLIELLGTMRDGDGNILIDGFYDNIRSLSETEKNLLKRLPFDRKDIAGKIGYPELDMDGETYYHKLTMEPSFNIFGMESGHTGDGVKTIIPSSARVKMDIRLVADQDPHDVFDKIVNHVNIRDSSVNVKFLGSMKPSRTPADLAVVRTVTEAVHDAYQMAPLVQPSLPGTLPDYVWTEILNTPSVIMPYANFDQQNHSPNENIKLENFSSGIKATCYVISTLGEHFMFRR